MRRRDQPVASDRLAHTVFMKNITLSVDEKVLAAVRRYSAERESSVNALVREFLTGLAKQQRLGTKAWTRDQLHER
jgi:hypothetical protein